MPRNAAAGTFAGTQRPRGTSQLFKRACGFISGIYRGYTHLEMETLKDGIKKPRRSRLR
jgi:hypothetical protein